MAVSWQADRLDEPGFVGQAGQFLFPEIEERCDGTDGLATAPACAS